MFDKTKFLVVGEAILGVDRANNRLNAAKLQLETAKSIVDSARADIETAKEGVAGAKVNLDTILTGFENSGLSKATIISTAEDLNRVFGALEPASEQDVVPEPELSKASARKVIDSLRDLVAVVAEREDYADLRSPLEDILAAVQTAGSSTKDDSETKPKRKRRSKVDEEETTSQASTDESVETSTQTVETQTDVAEVNVSMSVAEPTDGAAPVAAATASDIVPSPEVANTPVEAPAQAAAPATVYPVTEVAEPTNEVNNEEVRDEVFELIDANVTEDDLNSVLVTTAAAVYLASQDRPLSLSAFLDAMTVQTLETADGADYLDDEMRGLVATLLTDSTYVSGVLKWFREGVLALENGKDFSEFKGLQQAEEVASVESTAAEEVAEQLSEEAFSEAVEIADEPSAVDEGEFMSIDDDQTILGQVEEAPSVSEAENEPLVLAEEESVSTETNSTETSAAIVEKQAAAPARPAPSAPSDGLKKPTFFQRPSFPTKG